MKAGTTAGLLSAILPDIWHKGYNNAFLVGGGAPDLRFGTKYATNMKDYLAAGLTIIAIVGEIVKPGTEGEERLRNIRNTP